jgi:hypothetical protein
MDIDKQRISAVRMLEAIGYSYSNDEWLPPGASLAQSARPYPSPQRPTPCMGC